MRGRDGTLSVVMAVFNQVTLTRACLDSLARASGRFELCVVDNASADGTAAYFERWPHAFPRRYHRNASNVGLIRTLNQGAALAQGDVLCFLHNDTEMLDAHGLARLRGALDTPGIGLAGLYGARRLRRDGRYAGRTIVNALEGGAAMPAGVVDVAGVDGVCLCLPRALFERVGGFDEGYGFFHGYDRDLSFAVRDAGYRCVVVNTPFAHRGGGTRTGAGAPVRAAEDLGQRRAALARFATKWSHRLPSDVRTPRERWSDWLGALSRPGRGA